MPRRPNTKPTHIYWLIDIRPETIAAGWGNGQPFYCGKTVYPIQRRLWEHRHDAKRGAHRAISRRMAQCGEFVEIRLMETVPANQDWCEKERRWIWILRSHFPGCVNSADGGVGMPGYVHTPEAIERMRRSSTGKKHTQEAKDKVSRAFKGKKLTAEHIEKVRAALTGKAKTPEHCANMSRVRTGRKHTPETREKIRAAQAGKPKSAEHTAKMTAALTGKPKSAEHRRNLSEAMKASYARRAANGE